MSEMTCICYFINIVKPNERHELFEISWKIQCNWKTDDVETLGNEMPFIEYLFIKHKSTNKKHKISL
jgi:hypothetical protein